MGRLALLADRRHEDYRDHRPVGTSRATPCVPATASTNLRSSRSTRRKLRDAGPVAVDREGRHRYCRLADADVARLLEPSIGIGFRAGTRSGAP